MPRYVRDTWRHKELKTKAKTWLIGKGFHPFEEILVKPRNKNKGVTIDVVGFINGEPKLGIECGSLNQPIAIYEELPIPILHMALRSGLYPEDYPHKFGGCPYCNRAVAGMYGGY